MCQGRTLAAIVGNTVITAVDRELGMPMRLSEATKRSCMVRDKRECVLTRAGGLAEVAQMNVVPQDGSFWACLNVFWTNEEIFRWESVVFTEQSTEVLPNFITLSSNAHVFWGKVLFALKPLTLYRDRFKRSGVSHITYQNIGDALENDRELFQFLSYDVAGRSLPSKATLQGVDPSIISMLLRVLTHGSLEFNMDDVAMEKCFILGFIHVDEPKEGSTICVSPSLLHAR